MRDPDALISRADVRPDPHSDQHFLVDDRVLDRLPEHLPAWRPPDSDAHLLEIGAGTGALTDRLLATADRATVTAIERDPRLAAFLREEFAAERAADRLTVVEGDALEVDLPAFDAAVSNLPYGAASEFCFRLLPRRRPLVLTVQAEFADRMAAASGEDDYGRLSVTAGHYADVEVVEGVPPTAFEPRPAVESAVVRTTPREPAYEVPDEERFLDLVRAVFTQRRKTLRNAVRNTTHISGIDDATAERLVAENEALMDRRAGQVTPAEFARLAARSLAVETEAADAGGDPGGDTA
ncbi:ribosomal RNA small subunit methyltransferase A [Halobacteriales archaeon SW_5_70_135]|nr:MAG: ribosomal RNA small subunit methyltransferase A [Halobacteriales archaeon SW_5_70_135]